MKTLLKIIILMGVAGIILFFAIRLLGGDQKKTVVVKPASPVVITVDAFGVIKAKEIENIVIDFPAYIQEIHVREGQRVKKGERLVTLDMTQYYADIRSREIQMNTRQRELNVRRSYRNNNSDPDINRLYVDLQNAEYLYEQDLQQLAKRERLYASEVISQFEYEEYKKNVENRRKAVQDLKLSIDSLRFVKENERDQTANLITVLASELTAMRNRLSRPFLRGNTIISNMNNGVVYDINCLPGDRAGQTDQQLVKLFSILNLDSIVVIADVDEELMNDVKLGAAVDIVPLANRSKTYRGKVIRIADRAILKNNETYIPVEITIENMDETIRPEMNVDVKINTR